MFFTTPIIKIYSAFFGTQVGTDNTGNSYYTGKRKDSFGRAKRWVIYQGIPEASKIPAEWHLWLHYTSDKVPSHKYPWQKEHQPNATGTADAYFPKGHLLNQGKRAQATGDYEAWIPK